MTQEYWDKKFSVKDYYGTAHIPFAEECVEFIQKQKYKGKKLLDLGCGQGQDALFFANNGYEVTVLDFSEQALASIHNEKIKKIHQDMSDLSIFQNDSFDIVYASFSLHFFKIGELRKIFKEIHRILKPNGFFMFIAKNKKDKYYGKGEQIDSETFIYEGVRRYFFTEAVLKELLQGFKILRFTDNAIVETNTFYWSIIAQKNNQTYSKSKILVV